IWDSLPTPAHTMSRHPATRNPGALRHRPDCLSSADRHNVDRVRPLAFLGALVMACSSLAAHAGAPRDGDVFTNPAGSRSWPGPDVTLPFFARKTWTSLVGRDGAAPRVPYDRAAMLENPSLTWIGHSTFLVRMDGVTFLTDPMFSERASPVSFAGPKRLVPLRARERHRARALGEHRIGEERHAVHADEKRRVADPREARVLEHGGPIVGHARRAAVPTDERRPGLAREEGQG